MESYVSQLQRGLELGEGNSGKFSGSFAETIDMDLAASPHFGRRVSGEAIQEPFPEDRGCRGPGVEHKTLHRTGQHTDS